MSLRSGPSAAGKALLRRVAAGAWLRLNPGSLTVLAYHRVSDRFDPRIHLRGTWTHTDGFRRQVETLKETFAVVSLADGLERLRSRALDRPHVAITFDDGDSGLLDRAIPILAEARCPATLFVNSSYLDADRLHFPLVYRYLANSDDPALRGQVGDDTARTVELLRTTDDPEQYHELRRDIEDLSSLIENRRSLFLNRAQLESLPPDLFQVGLHGHVHQRFSMLTRTEQAESLDRDLEALRPLPGYCPAFAIPFGGPRDWNRTTLELCLARDLTPLSCTGETNRTDRLPVDRVQVDNLDAVRRIRESWTGIR